MAPILPFFQMTGSDLGWVANRRPCFRAISVPLVSEARQYKMKQREAMKRILNLSLAAGTAMLASSAFANTIVVNQFQNLGGPPSADAWYYNEMQGAGTATIENLTGQGGNLETAQPLPPGAARLTTGGSNSDKAQVSTYADYGLASSVLSSINLSYSYYKANVGAPAPAPSIKLTIEAPAAFGHDHYGTLIYEPYWNQSNPGPGASGTPPTDAWQTVSIDENNGVWWWNGGFGYGSGAGGPPLKTLADWLVAFQGGNDANHFANARVTTLTVGIGTYNLNQDGYFDAVSIQTGNIDKTYNFQPRAVPDAGATLALLSVASLGLVALRRKLAS